MRAMTGRLPCLPGVKAVKIVKTHFKIKCHRWASKKETSGNRCQATLVNNYKQLHINRSPIFIWVLTPLVSDRRLQLVLATWYVSLLTEGSYDEEINLKITNIHIEMYLHCLKTVKITILLSFLNSRKSISKPWHKVTLGQHSTS